MLFRALKIVCALTLALSVSGCITGETVGSAACCYPNAITLDGNPVPGNGDIGEHYDGFWCAQRHNFRHAEGTIEYWALNTNSDLPPYETFWCDQWPRANYQIAKKFDEHFLNYDWDDPFIQCCEPKCCQPQCHMKYVKPCDRKQRCEPCVPCTPCEAAPCEPCGVPCARPAIDGPR